MKLKTKIFNFAAGILATAGLTPAMSGCHAIYDDSDCVESYNTVRFEYTHNMKFADAFAHEVNVVTLYLLDVDGKVVWQRTEQGESLAADDYAMTIDVEPGEYELLA